MKDWYKFWLEQNNSKLVYQLCKDEKINDNTKFIFITETENIGCCCGFQGSWIWSSDNKKLASFILEHSFRKVLANKTNVDFEETLDKSSLEFCTNLANTSGSFVDRQLLVLAQKMVDLLNSELSLDDIRAWTDKLESISWKTPLIINCQVFENVDKATQLLLSHEQQFSDKRKNYDITKRFMDDYLE